MKKISIFENYIFNIILFIFSTSFPLITAPYVSRVLGTNNIGIVNYSFSIISMYIIFAEFGVTVYGVRGVAKYKEDRKKLSNFVSSIFILSLILTSIISVIYIISIPYFTEDNKNIWIIMFMYLAFVPLSFEWFFIGSEKFKYVTIRSVIIKVISLGLIFIFVREKDHYIRYAIILMISQVFNFLVNFISAKKYWDFSLNGVSLVNTFKESSIFFVTIFISSLFTTFDKVLVGTFTDNSSLALYFRNRQITTMTIGITTALVRVLTPRLAILMNNKSNREYKELLYKSYNYYLLIALPTSMGLIFLGKEILFIFGGIEFLKGYDSFIILSIWLLFAGINVFVDNQISIPNNKEVFTTISCIIIAILNVFLNLILTPKYGIMGASLALLISEISGSIVHILLLKRSNLFFIKLFDKNIIKIILATITMGIILQLIKLNTSFSYLINIIVLVPIGILTYFFTLHIVKEDIIKGLTINIFFKIKKIRRRVLDEY